MTCCWSSSCSSCSERSSGSSKPKSWPLSPYLAVGIIACTRRILTASAELSHLPQVTSELFNRYIFDVALNVAVIMVLIIAVFLVRKRPDQAAATS